MNKIKTIVFAGGPSSGKSESIEKLRTNLTELGYKVVIIPELASEIRQNGLIQTEGIISKIDFQRVIFKLQLYKEELYKNIMQKNTEIKKIILLLDRGLLDSKIYLEEDEYNKLLKEHNLTEKDIINRYDVVFHLESTANLDNNNYNNYTNKYRFSNKEQAKQQEIKSIEVWSKHPKFYNIKLEKTLDEKIKKLEKKIIKEING